MRNNVSKYIRQFRPYEAEITPLWILSALKRKYTQTCEQSAPIKAGFPIYWCLKTDVSRNHTDPIVQKIIDECLALNTSVYISDLLTVSAAFKANKEN